MADYRRQILDASQFAKGGLFYHKCTADFFYAADLFYARRKHMWPTKKDIVLNLAKCLFSISVVFSITGWFLLWLWIRFFIIYGMPFFLAILFLWSVSVISSVIFLILTRKNNVKNRKRYGVICGLAFSFIGLAFIILSPMLFSVTNRPVRLKLCSERIAVIGDALLNYAQEHDGKLPHEDTWLDLLIEERLIMDANLMIFTDGMIVCSGMGVPSGQTSFAMNTNLDSSRLDEISPNTVLLFEAKGAKNAHGGRGSLTFDNHKNKATVLFVSGEVRQISPKEAKDLKWGQLKGSNPVN
jgi:hypothetical protein